MNINFNAKLDIKNREIQEFIFDSTQSYFMIPGKAPAGYSFDITDMRDPKLKVYSDKVDFFVREEYVLLQNSATVGNNFFTSVYGQVIDADVAVCLYLKNGLDQAIMDKARSLFKSYDFATDGDIYPWIKSKLDDTLTSETFIIETAIILEKSGQRIKVNTSQVDEFEKLYTQKDDGNPKSSKVHIVTDKENQPVTIFEWATDLQITFRKVGEELLLDLDKPKVTKDVKDLAVGEKADKVVGAVLNDLLQKILPSSCGPMTYAQQKLLTLLTFPEFMIEWHDLVIKNDCFTITISYPVLKTRLASLVIYLYYFLPKSVGNAVLAIIKVCAIRAAIGGSVIGLVTSNPAAAIVAFSALFENCIEKEFVNCLNPGILTLKEIVQDWH